MMDPAEVEFLAEKLMVEIVPNFNFDRVYLISGEVGPFRAGLPVKVPIWMAVNLRQRQKCRILVPDWMDVEKLELVKEEESASRFFTKMPSEHYMAEAQLILSTCGEDVPRADEIRTALKDLWDMRMSKLRASVDVFIKSGGTHARLDHLTLMELNSVRPLLPHALDQLQRLRRTFCGEVYLGLSPGELFHCCQHFGDRVALHPQGQGRKGLRMEGDSVSETLAAMEQLTQ